MADAVEAYGDMWKELGKGIEKQVEHGKWTGEQKKVAEMQSVKMDIAVSVNFLEDVDASVVDKIHEIISYGFALLEGNPDDREPPESWCAYNSAETQRRIMEGIRGESS